MTVHVFGVVDSPCCANDALQRTALDQSENFSEEAVHAVLRNVYMDDVLSSKPDSKGPMQLINFLATEGFRLTKWMSNIRKVLAAIPSSEVAWDMLILLVVTCHKSHWCQVGHETRFPMSATGKSGFPDTKKGILCHK